MKDKEIRRILVEWIQVRFDEVRIYQESWMYKVVIMCIA